MGTLNFKNCPAVETKNVLPVPCGKVPKSMNEALLGHWPPLLTVIGELEATVVLPIAADKVADPAAEKVILELNDFGDTSTDVKLSVAGVKIPAMLDVKFKVSFPGNPPVLTVRVTVSARGVPVRVAVAAAVTAKLALIDPLLQPAIVTLPAASIAMLL